MARVVIDIINEARGRLGLPDLSTADYDTSLERPSVHARNEFSKAFRKLILSGTIDFTRTITMSTIAGTPNYALPFPLEESTQIDSRNIQITGINQANISYVSYDEAILRYPDLSQIPQGKPENWFIAPSGVIGDNELRFILTPDDVYPLSITFSERPIVPTAAEITPCGFSADNYLFEHMYAAISEVEGIPSSIDTLQAWNQFIAQDHNMFTRDYFVRPYQHFN